MCAANLAVPILVLAFFSVLLWSLRDSWVAWGLLLPFIVPLAVFIAHFFSGGCYGEVGITSMVLAFNSFWVTVAFSLLISLAAAFRNRQKND